MAYPRIGIMGATGWLGGALGRNLLRRGHPPEGLTLLNRSGPSADYAPWPQVCWAQDLPDLLARCDHVVLSVRPEDYRLPAPHPFDGQVISFMAGVSLSDLARDWPKARIARAMPGGSASQGTAHVPWCGAGDPAPVLSALGQVDRVADEGALAYLSALSGSGAAYPALMAQALLAHATAQGIAPDTAWNAVRSVVCAAPALFAAGPDQAAALLETYRGYRGITAAGLAAAEAAGFAASLHRALEAATAKALDF